MKARVKSKRERRIVRTMSECTNNSDSSGAIVLEDLFYTARFGSHATKWYGSKCRERRETSIAIYLYLYIQKTRLDQILVVDPNFYFTIIVDSQYLNLTDLTNELLNFSINVIYYKSLIINY